MHAKSALALAAALPLLLLALPAHAADDSDDPHATFSKAHPLQLRSGGEFLSGERTGLKFRRTASFVGLGYDWSPDVLLYADLHYGTTRFGYKASLEDDLAVNAKFRSVLDVSASAGMSLRMMRSGPFWLDTGLEFETSIVNSRPSIQSLDITTPQGRFSITPYAQRASELDAAWYRFQLSSTFGARFGIFEPRMLVGFSYVHAALDVKLQTDGRDTLAALGHDSAVFEEPHNAGFFQVVLAPGLNLRLGERDTIGVSASVAPASTIEAFGFSGLFTHRF